MLRHQRGPAHPYQLMPARLLAMSRGRQPSDRLKLLRHRLWKVVRRALASSLSGAIWGWCREPEPVEGAVALAVLGWAPEDQEPVQAHGWPVCNQALVV